MTFIEKEGDLIPLVQRLKPPLRRCSRCIDRFDVASWWQVNASKVDDGRRDAITGSEKTDMVQLNQSHFNHPDNFQSTTTVYSEEGAIDNFVTCATILLGLAMLIAPLWLLRYVYAEGPDLTKRLGVITAFICGFTGVLSFVAVVKPFEVLAATAAYGAVLMVFIQIGNTS